MTNNEPWTIKRLLTWTTDFLKENGADSPRLDAEVLLAKARDCKRIELYTSYDEVPVEEVLQQFRGWIKQLAAGKPVAYLVGHREFYSLSFRVNQHVLIPRPETETLVTLAIDFAAALANGKSQAETAVTICDVGTGSGCIPIAIAVNNKNCHLTAIDISPEALLVARENSKLHRVEDRIEFVESNLFAALDEQQKFDCIVSNPPYIGHQERDQLPRDVLDHEPHQALFSGETGLETITELIDQSAERLRSGGQLMIELSPMLAQDGFRLLESHSAFTNAKIVQDLSKSPRVIVASRR